MQNPKNPLHRTSVDAAENRRPTVQSLGLALDILEHITAAPRDVGLSELAAELSVTKSALHRYLNTLVDRNYLTKDPATSRYAAGPSLTVLAGRASAKVDLAAAALPEMERLSSDVQLTVNLGTARGEQISILASVVAKTPIEIGIPVGSSLPLLQTSQGRAIAAYSPEMRIPKSNGRAFTSRTCLDHQKIARTFPDIRRRGWASAPEEVVLGINAVSAPIFDDNEICIGAITLVGSIQHLPNPPLDEQICRLHSTAKLISRQMGYLAGYPRKEAD